MDKLLNSLSKFMVFILLIGDLSDLDKAVLLGRGQVEVVLVRVNTNVDNFAQDVLESRHLLERGLHCRQDTVVGA